MTSMHAEPATATDLTAAIYAYLTGAGGSAFNGAPVEIIAAWQGDDHLLWRVESRGREAIVKLFLDAGQARSRRQFDGHTLMHALDLAPAPLWVDRYPEGLARQVLVYTWAEGAPLVAADDSGLTTLAQAVARLHASPIDNVRRFSPHPLNLETYWRIESAGLAQILAWLPGDTPLHATLAALLRAAHDQVQAALPLWQSAPPAPVHGDLRLDHALGAPAGSAINLVDWEMFGIGDSALDVARFLHRETVTLGPGARERWLQAYLDALDNGDQAARITIYRDLLPLGNAAYLLNGLRTHSPDGITPQLAAALPDIGATLSASLENAAAAYAIAPHLPFAEQVAALVDRLQTPIATAD